MTIRVILVEPEKEGNIGSVARVMSNFDLDDLWIVNPKVPIDGEARAYAMHGQNVLTTAKTVRTLDLALEGVDLAVGTSAVVARSTSNLLRLAITPKDMAKKARATKKGCIAIVFGRESSGLSNQETENCDFLVTIPASHEYNVLNLASAASIIFYELFQTKAFTGVELASRDSKKRLLAEFDRLARMSETPLHRRKLAQRSFSNIISRSFISSREASLLIGVFRRALSKAK